MFQWLALHFLKIQDHFMVSEQVDQINGAISAMFPVGAMAGSVIAYLCMPTLTPKIGLEISNGFCFVTLLTLIAAFKAQTVVTIIILEIFIGIFLGMGCVFSCVLLVDMAPVQIRGCTFALFLVMSAIGKLAGIVSGFEEFLGTVERWQWMYAFPAAMSLFMIFMLRFIPDSPKCVYMKRTDYDEVEEDLAWFRKSWDVGDELEDLIDEMNLQKEISQITFANIWQHPSLKSPLIVSMFIMTATYWSGGGIVLYCSSISISRLVRHKDDFEKVTLGLFAIHLTMIFLGMLLIDKVGRRLLLLIGLMGSLVMCLVLGANYTFAYEEDPDIYFYIKISSLMVLVAVYSIGIPPVTYLLPAELFPLKIRTLPIAMAMFINFLSFVLNLTFYLVHNWLHDNVFYVFAVANLLYFIFVFIFVPETKCLNYRQIYELYNKHHEEPE